jgi:hypothetical protein
LSLRPGRVIQLHDPHQIATAEGTHRGKDVVGVLHESGTFEVINAGQIASVSVGLHPVVKADLAARRAEAETRYGVSEK